MSFHFSASAYVGPALQVERAHCQTIESGPPVARRHVAPVAQGARPVPRVWLGRLLRHVSAGRGFHIAPLDAANKVSHLGPVRLDALTSHLSLFSLLLGLRERASSAFARSFYNLSSVSRLQVARADSGVQHCHNSAAAALVIAACFSIEPFLVTGFQQLFFPLPVSQNSCGCFGRGTILTFYPDIPCFVNWSTDVLGISGKHRSFCCSEHTSQIFLFNFSDLASC